MAWCFDAVTENSARVMNLDGYGVAEGCKANLVLLQATNKVDAIRLRAHRLAVVRAGRIVSSSAETTHELYALSGSSVNEARLI